MEDYLWIILILIFVGICVGSYFLAKMYKKWHERRFKKRYGIEEKNFEKRYKEYKKEIKLKENEQWKKKSILEKSLIIFLIIFAVMFGVFGFGHLIITQDTDLFFGWLIFLFIIYEIRFQYKKYKARKKLTEGYKKEKYL